MNDQLRTATSESHEIYARGTRDAVALLQAFRRGDPVAVDRVQQARLASEEVCRVVPLDDDGRPALVHPYYALQVISHEQTGQSWAAMCLGPVNAASQILPPDHAFVAAVKAHDLDAVRLQLQRDDALANARIRGAAWHLQGTVWEPDAPAATPVADDDPRTTTMLHHAAVRAGNAPLAGLLLDHGAAPDALGFQDNCDVSPPIRLAAWEGDLDTMRLLLEAGANPDFGLGSLFSALEHNRSDKADLLLAHGARHDLCTAAMRGDLTWIRRLVEEDSEQLQQPSPSRGRLPIIEAINVGQIESARLLAALGSPVPPEAAVALGGRRDGSG